MGQRAYALPVGAQDSILWTQPGTDYRAYSNHTANCGSIEGQSQTDGVFESKKLNSKKKT